MTVSRHAFQLTTVLFDMDGTLVSTLPLIHYCINKISQKYAHREVPVDEIVASFGPPARAIVRSLVRSRDEKTQSAAIEEYYKCYESNVSNQAHLFPGISSLLSKVQESGKQIALVTGVERPLMDYTLDAFDLSKYFSVKVCRDDVKNGKPDPEGILLALAKTKSFQSQTIFIGDAPADILAGKRAGVMTAAALWGPENRGDPRSEGPDIEFTTVEQLATFLLPP